MKTRLIAGVIFALLAANVLVAQTAAMPPPTLLTLEGIDPADTGEYYVPCGHEFTLATYFSVGVTDFAILATPCGLATTMCWEIIAQGSEPLPDAMFWSGFVPQNMPPCSFMLALAVHDGMGWWYISRPLVVHVGVDIPVQ